MAGVVKNFSSLGAAQRMRQLQSMTANPFGMLGGQPKKGSTGKRLTPKEREAQRKRLEKERRNKKKKK